MIPDLIDIEVSKLSFYPNHLVQDLCMFLRGSDQQNYGLQYLGIQEDSSYCKGKIHDSLYILTDYDKFQIQFYFCIANSA